MNDSICHKHQQKAALRCKNCLQNNLLCFLCLEDHSPGHTFEDADTSKRDKLVQQCKEGWETLIEKKDECMKISHRNLSQIKKLIEDIELHQQSLDSFVFRKYTEIANQYQANLNQSNFDAIVELETERKSAEQRFDLFFQIVEPFTNAIESLSKAYDILNEGNQEHLDRYLQHKAKMALQQN